MKTFRDSIHSQQRDSIHTKLERQYSYTARETVFIHSLRDSIHTQPERQYSYTAEIQYSCTARETVFIHITQPERQ